MKHFWDGIKFKIPLCCILFFESAWKNIDRMEYGSKMHILTNNNGMILCPQCICDEVEF